MIDTEHVKCDTCTAPEPMELDASDEASRGWPTVDIETNPYKAQFPLFQQHPEIAFLDSAATAQRPACVLDAERDFYQRMNANPLRGLYSLSVEATEAIAKVRQQIADVIGAPQANEIVFTRNTSESLNLVAKSFAPTVLEPGDEVVITIMEHHSNLIPWQQVCRETGAKLVYLYPTKTGQLTTEEVLAKVGPKTKILAVGQVSNVLGVENPVKNLGKLVHKYGGYLVVDGAQSLPHMPVDVADLGADFFAFSAHKAMGPMGIGVLWGKMDLLNAMPPMLTGGEMIDSVTEQDAVWAPVPEKFEAGTQDAAGIFATGAALDYLVNTVGYENIQAREKALVHYLMGELMQLDFVQIIGSIYWDNHHGVVSFNVKGIHPHDVASIMDMDGVCIRAGHHCAQPLLTWLGVENLACCRASVAFYNDKADIDKFIAGLHHVWSTFNGESVHLHHVYGAQLAPRLQVRDGCPHARARRHQPQLRRRAHPAAACREQRDRGGLVYRARLRYKPGQRRHHGRSHHGRDGRGGASSGRALPRYDPWRAALRGGPGRPGRSRPAPGHLAHARPRQMRRARLAHPRRHAHGTK